MAMLVFFLGLALGVRSVVLGEVFPVDRFEVEPKARDLNLLAIRLQLGDDTLDVDLLERLAAIPGVAAVYPKMKLTMPAVASGGETLLGSALQTELVADGIDPILVRDEVGEAFEWLPPAASIRCATNGECPDGSYCGDGVYGKAGVCRAYIPVLVSRHLLELYNGSFRRAYGFPKLNPDFAVGLGFEMAFGASTLRAPTRRGVVRERMRLVGFSDKAIALGVTLPIEFVRRVNAGSKGPGVGSDHHSAIVELADRRRISEVMAAVQAMDLVVKDGGAQRAAIAVAVMLAVVAAVGGAMLIVATVSVAHAFFMIVGARKKELGVLRAIGAHRGDVRAMILGEAAVVGAVAGGMGAALAVAAGRVFDIVGGGRIPDFPYKPESFFEFPVWLIVGAIFVAVIASIMGALLPVQRAAAKDPADLLTDA